jgi:hypothetical protein
MPITLHARESREDRRHHLPQIFACLREAVKAVAPGWPIVAEVGAVARGWWPMSQRIDLLLARMAAQHYGGIVLGESASRYLRHRRFHANLRPDLLPTPKQYRRLTRGDIIWATLLDPDLAWQDVKRHEKKRGDRFTDLVTKQPHKVRRQRFMPLVTAMHAQGFSLRQMADALNSLDSDLPHIMHRTILDWLNKAETDVQILGFQGEFNQEREECGLARYT